MIDIPEYVQDTVAKLRIPYKGPFKIIEVTPTNIRAKQTNK